MAQPPEDGESRLRDSEQPTVIDGKTEMVPKGPSQEPTPTARFDRRSETPRDAHATIVKAPRDGLPAPKRASTFSRLVILLVLLIVILALVVLTLFLLRQPGSASDSAQASTTASTPTRTVPTIPTSKATAPSETTTVAPSTQLTSGNQSTVEGPLPAGAFRIGLAGVRIETPATPADGVNWDLKFDPFNQATLRSANTVQIDRWPGGTNSPTLSECAGFLSGRNPIYVYSVVTNDRICVMKGKTVAVLHVQKVENQDIVADLVTSQP